MLLIDFGLCIGVYWGIKRFKKSKKQAVQLTGTNKKQAVQPTEESKTLKHYDHHLKVSTASFGLVSIGYFIPASMIIGLGIYLYTAFPLFKRTALSLKNGKLGNDVLTAAIILTCLFTAQYFALVAGSWFYYFAQKLLAKTKNHTKSTLVDVCKDLPSKVWVMDDGYEIEVPFSKLKINDIVIINMGEIVPVDGTIMEGNAIIDQHVLTGESQPVEKDQGDIVFASTLLIAGKIFVRIDKKGEDTVISNIGRMLNDSSSLETQFQSGVEKWADKAATFVLGFTTLALPILTPASAAAVLNSSFGNRLIATTSLATLNYITAAHRNGILVKDACALEKLVQVDSILFDKTGTLTKEQPEVGKIIAYNGYLEPEILACAASVEYKLKHPIAKAIIQKAIDLDIPLFKVEDSQYQMGFGIYAEVDNKPVHLGSLRFLTMENIDFPATVEDFINEAHEQGFSVIALAINREIAGIIEIRPTVRPEIKEIIESLKKSGVNQLAIVSGDQQEPTKRLSKHLGMDDYFYQVLPEEKADIVEKLQAKGKKVCFIGDGVNDALAIKKADVSISLRGASSVAVDLSDIVFLNGDLSRLIDLFNRAKKLNTHFKNNLLINAVPSVIVISGAFIFKFNMIASVLVESTTLLIGLGYAVSPLKKHKNAII